MTKKCGKIIQKEFDFWENFEYNIYENRKEGKNDTGRISKEVWI